MDLEKERLEWQDKIDELAGMEEFKALLQEWMTLYPILKKANNEHLVKNRAYLFSIGDGEGFSKQLSLMAQAITLLKGTGERTTVKEISLPYEEVSERSKKNATPTTLGIDALRSQGAFTTGNVLLAVDIRDWMGKTELPHFRRILEYLFENAEGPFVFRVPLVDEKHVKQVESAIADIRNVQIVITNETTMDEYLHYARILAKRRGGSISAEAEEALEVCLIEEKNQGNMRGYGTVKKIFNEILYQKLIQMGKEHV